MPGSFIIDGHVLRAGVADAGLHLVATPIGNLQDITLRALHTLAAADIVACEDTRVTRKLLDRYAIDVRPVAYHEHNAARAGPKLLAALQEGRSVALVSDAGTPLVSDPGYRLVAAAVAQGIRVIPLPGASAPMAALVASGLPTDSFFFAGFLPNRHKARLERLEALAGVPATLVAFESPRRLAASLEDCTAVLGVDRPAAVCRELTKAYEEVRRGTLGELAAHYSAAMTVKGEIVLVVGAALAEDAGDEDVDALLAELLTALPPARAATEAARRTGRPRKDLYRRLLDMKDASG